MQNNTKKEKVKYRKRKIAAKIGISILLLGWFASKVDLHETAHLILTTNYLILIACVLLYLLGQSISAYKWSIISSTIGFKQKISNYIQYYFIGMFFNLFLPSTIGGDVSKAYYLSKGDTNKRKAPSIYTVLAERFSGLAVLAWLGTLALLSPIGQQVPKEITYCAAGLSLAILIGSPLFPWFVKHVFSEKSWMNRSMMNDVTVFWDHKLVIRCLGWSLLFHSIIVLIHVLIGMAMHLDINILYYLAVYPIVAIIGFIPIAFNGIGVREGAYIYFFSLIGISKSAGLAFGLLWFIVVVITSLIGGIIYIKGNHTPPPEEYDPGEFNLTDIASENYDQLQAHAKLEKANKVTL